MGLLEFLTGGDWISPTAALAKCIAQGHRPISIYSGARKAKKALGRRGIKTQLIEVEEGYVLIVHKDYRDYAYEILKKEKGVNLA